MRRLRTVALAVALAGAVATAPAANAWQDDATATGWSGAGGLEDVFYLHAENNGQRSIARIQVDPFNGGRPIATYVHTVSGGAPLWDYDYTIGPNVESSAYGDMVAAQYRFRSGYANVCTRWDYDPWNRYVQRYGNAKDTCPEQYTPPGLRPVTDLVLR